MCACVYACVHLHTRVCHVHVCTCYVCACMCAHMCTCYVCACVFAHARAPCACVHVLCVCVRVRAVTRGPRPARSTSSRLRTASPCWKPKAGRSWEKRERPPAAVVTAWLLRCHVTLGTEKGKRRRPLCSPLARVRAPHSPHSNGCDGFPDGPLRGAPRAPRVSTRDSDSPRPPVPRHPVS